MTFGCMHSGPGVGKCQWTIGGSLSMVVELLKGQFNTAAANGVC
jgi:hypothetical protein